jgi:Trypsin
MQVNIADHPYQVALVHAGVAAANPAGQYCGGTIRDSTHVITAAHCVFNLDGSGQPAQPDQIDVLAGTANLSNESAGQRVQVERVSFEPDYDANQFSYDAALLTLATPLQNVANIQPTQIVSDDTWQAISTGDSLFVTGWGSTSYGGSTVTKLRGVSVDYYTPQDCENEPSFIVDLEPGQICATGPNGHDSCRGDSGGPLVVPGGSAADDRLAGIVSSGVGCGSSQFPGIYTEAAYPPIRAFLEQADAPAAPSLQSAPVLSGPATVGRQLTCSPGTWSGSPSFTYQFVRSVQSRDVGVAAAGASNQYTITSADLGTMLRCDVRAANSGGSALASSAPTGTVAAAPSTPPTSPPSTPPPAQQTQTNLDLNAPVARITKVRCTVTRCTLSVTVRDAGFSAGIRTVRASVRSTYRSRCTRQGRKVACTKTKTGRPSVKALSATRFRVVASKLPVGKQLFTLVAVDKAGHRQALPTRKTITTKRKKTTRR